MEKLTNWTQLWAQLSQMQDAAFARQRKSPKDDFWKDRAKVFDKMVNKRWEQPDSSREFLLEKLKAHPGSSLLDIGAGTGNWALFAAPHAARVTAMEPSAPMGEILTEKISKGGIKNIQVLKGRWPEDAPGPHDFVLASHSMYGEEDFKGFVDKMNQIATKGCIMVLRAPYKKAVMAQAAQKIWGQPYDSPNFQVALNILHSMDIYPHVVMEKEYVWQSWRHPDLEAARQDVKNRLNILDTDIHDAWLTDLLASQLTREGDEYIWPPGNRAALVYWEV